MQRICRGDAEEMTVDVKKILYCMMCRATSRCMHVACAMRLHQTRAPKA